MKAANWKRYILFWCLILLILPSCSERSPRPVVVPLEGVIVRIDLENRIVRVRYHNPKHNRDEEWPIHISSETELLINDVLAEPEDAHPGELATGTVRIETRGKNEKWLTALRVRIDRESEPAPEPIIPAAASQPSSSS